MRASTDYKALLRYLYLREAVASDPNADLAEVLSELERLESGLNRCYGFSSLGGVRSAKVRMNLDFLHQSGLAKYSPTNPHVELTELGRALASGLEFSEELEKAVKVFFGDRDSSSGPRV